MQSVIDFSPRRRTTGLLSTFLLGYSRAARPSASGSAIRSGWRDRDPKGSVISGRDHRPVQRGLLGRAHLIGVHTAPESMSLSHHAGRYTTKRPRAQGVQPAKVAELCLRQPGCDIGLTLTVENPDPGGDC